MPDWNWGESQSESGVVHQSTVNTDHNDAATLKQGYDYATFSEITPDPVACWPLHEDSGSTAYDVAGTNDGTINGATVGQTGILGTTAYSFDGTDDYVTTGTTVVSDTDFTVTVWAKIDSTSTSSDFPGYVCQRDGYSTMDFTLYYDKQNDSLRFDVGEETDNGLKTTPPTAGVWEMVTAVRNGNTLTLYRDATQLTENTFSSVSFTPSDTTVIGTLSPTSSPFPGDIWDPRIYDTALTASEIQTLYDVVNTTGTWTGTAKPL